MQTSRIDIIRIFFAAFGVLIISRLFYIQVLAADRFKSQASSQYQSISSANSPRGNILSSDNYPLVHSFPSYLMFADPTLIGSADRKKISFDLVSILYPEASPSATKQLILDTENLLSDQNLRWTAVHRQITPDQKNQIESLQIPGVGFDENTIRVYPESSMSAHILGFVGKDENGYDKGYFGLEGYYNLDLTGHPEVVTQERDLLGIPILIGKRSVDKGSPARSLVTSIDRSAQFVIEEKLKQGLENYGAKAGTVSIMEPQTGRILAMAAYPSYDPAKFTEFDTAYYKNPLVADTYEPGSTFKVVSMAAAIDSGAVDPDTVCTRCAGPVKLDKYLIQTWDNKYYPNSTMTDVIIHSDNTGMVFAGDALGTENFLKYYQAFGFNKPTGIDLQEEITPPFKSPDQWTFIDRSTAMFGQGIAVTPIQMLRAVGAIANGGKLLTPKVVDKIIDGDEVLELPPGSASQVISQETANKITQIMVKAVESGEAKWAKPKDFNIAGKTGTAQIPVSGHYDAEKTIASFIGFAPAENPRFVMLVTLHEPQSSPWGSETAAPLWFAIARDLLRLWNITPL